MIKPLTVDGGGAARRAWRARICPHRLSVIDPLRRGANDSRREILLLSMWQLHYSWVVLTAPRGGGALSASGKGWATLEGGGLLTRLKVIACAGTVRGSEMVFIGLAKLKGWWMEGGCGRKPGSCHKRQKPQAPTPQASIRDRQTRKVANAKGLNRNTNLT